MCVCSLLKTNLPFVQALEYLSKEYLPLKGAYFASWSKGFNCIKKEDVDGKHSM